MKVYRIEFAGGALGSLFALICFTLLCISVIGLPFAIATLPTLYRIVEDSGVSADQ
jgi:hypothetical protein